MAPASMEELAQAPDSHEIGIAARRHRDGFLIANSYAPPAAAGFTPEALAAAAPAVRVGFHAAFPRPNIYPADAGGAVSARYVLSVNNDGVSVNDRAGNQLSYVRLGQFWTDPSLPSGAVYFPKAIYDAANDRFVITTNYYVDSKNGRYLIAISDSGNPAATWKRYSFPVDPDGNRVADIPRIAQNADSILLTANTFNGDFAYGCDIVIIGKSYGSTPPIDAIRFFSTFDLAPLTTYDKSRKVVENEIPNAVVADVIVGTGLRNGIVYPTPHTYIFSFSQEIGPQLGSGVLLDSGDTLLEGGVIRNGTTWLIETVLVVPGRTAIRVWRITGNTVKTYLIENPEAVYAFPSIAVNRFGGAIIGYNVFMSTIYPSAGYSYIDPAGNLSAPAILKNGETPYSADGTGRWGDYTTTVVDPIDDTSFWTEGIYSVQSNEWATWWGYLPVAGIGRTRATKH